MMSNADLEFFHNLRALCEDLAFNRPADEDRLFQLTRFDSGPEPLVQLAESFALMLIKVMVRSYENEQLISHMQSLNSELAGERQALVEGNLILRQAMQERYNLPNVVAQCPAMRRIVQLALTIARRPINTMILGPTGSGKEVIAKLIHNNSPHRDGPFIAVNCTAIPESLFESEMFGIEKGVATGVLARKGLIEEAHEGTLFLDEVAEMTLVNQAKMLRVLEEREVVRLGRSKPIPVDINVICATHERLEERVAKGLFRQDLYYRLNVAEIVLPPLSERGNDVLLLAQFFLDIHCAAHKRRRLTLSPEVREALMVYQWPGNVRELSNEMERVAALTAADQVDLRDMSWRVQECMSKMLDAGEPTSPESGQPDANAAPPAASASGSSVAPDKGECLDLGRNEQRLIRRALAVTEGNRSRAAELLGLTREGLRKKLLRMNA